MTASRQSSLGARSSSPSASSSSSSTQSSAPRASALLAAASLLLLLSTATTATAAAAATASQTLSLRGGLGLIQQQQQQQQSLQAATSVTAAPRLFPPACSCERSAAKSPLRLSLDAVAYDAEPGPLQRFCFRLDTAGGCDPTSRCCQPLASAASKIEFDVVADCKKSLRRVTINGKPSPYVYDTQLSVLRIPGLGAAAAAPGGDQVCVYLDAESSCPSLSDLCTNHKLASGAASPAVGGSGGGAAACRYSVFNAGEDCCPVSFVATRPPLTPPPPPPPPPSTTTTIAAATTTTTTAITASTNATASTVASVGSDFPYFQCRRDAAGSRLFAAASPNVTSAPGGLTRICFDVGLHDTCADPSSPCCDFSLYKMEFEVDAACANSLAYTTIDGIQHVRFFQTAPQATIKVVNLDRPVSTANGTRICLFLRPECNTLAKLCTRHDGTCTVGLFNKPHSRAAAAAATGAAAASCCPLSTVSL